MNTILARWLEYIGKMCLCLCYNDYINNIIIYQSQDTSVPTNKYMFIYIYIYMYINS